MVYISAVTLTTAMIIIVCIPEERLRDKLFYTATGILLLGFFLIEKPMWMNWVAVGALAVKVTRLLIDLIKLLRYERRL